MSRLLPSLSDTDPGERDPRVVGVDDDDADALIAALGSETARAILTTLHDEPATKSELASDVDTSLQNVQYHLSRLEDADLVDVIDTVYSEKGREMDVYAAADEPLVLFAGGTAESAGIKSALLRLLGGYGLIGLAGIAAQRLLAVDPTTTFHATTGDDAGVTTDDEPAEEADTVDDSPAEAPAESVGGETGFERVIDTVSDPLTDHAIALLEPGVVFALGAALVFTVVWAYWYWSHAT